MEISVERVKEELAKLAFVDPRNFFRADGSAKEITQMDAATAACVAGMEIEDQYEGHSADRKYIGKLKKFKLADKGQNLERLGRHLKMSTDKVEFSPEDIFTDA